MASLQKLETARWSRPVNAGFGYDDKDMAELSARSVLAGVPQYLVTLYQLANDAARNLGRFDPPGRGPEEMELDEATEMLASSLIDDAAVLVVRALWHPWLSVLSRRRRAQKVRGLIRRVFPSADYRGRATDEFALEWWERARAEYRQWKKAQEKQLAEGKDPPTDKLQHG